VPATVSSAESSDCEDVCSICLSSLADGQELVRLKNCTHIYHKDCIEPYFAKGILKCPMCKVVVGDALGPCPPGTLTWTTHDRGMRPLAGFAEYGTIEFTYDIPSGTQTSIHPNPSRPYSGAQRIAYIPASDEGWATFDLLKKAFEMGFVFRVGDSLSSRQTDTITWSSIPHKTATNGGGHGYPDRNYLVRLKDALSQCGFK